MPQPRGLIAGRYQLRRRIGVGAMGDVYAAVHSFTGKHVAVKLLNPGAGGADPQTFAMRFLREARAASEIGHPGIVDVYDAGQDHDGRLYLVLELLEGRDLGSAVASGDVTVDEIVSVGVQTLQALAAAHERHIIHRDVKPENIFLTRDEHGNLRVKVLDFGISKPLVTREHLATTRQGVIVGTPYYMSPEQTANDEIDGRSDVWAVGAVLFHALTGRPPHDEDNYNRLVVRILRDDPPRLATVRPDLPPWLAQTVDRALTRDRQARWPSAKHMALALASRSMEGLELDWDDGEDRTATTPNPFADHPDSMPPPSLLLTSAPEPAAAPPGDDDGEEELASTSWERPAPQSGERRVTAPDGPTPPARVTDPDPTTGAFAMSDARRDARASARRGFLLGLVLALLVTAVLAAAGVALLALT